MVSIDDFNIMFFDPVEISLEFSKIEVPLSSIVPYKT
jgi:hypothetical protein